MDVYKCRLLTDGRNSVAAKLDWLPSCGHHETFRWLISPAIIAANRHYVYKWVCAHPKTCSNNLPILDTPWALLLCVHIHPRRSDAES